MTRLTVLYGHPDNPAEFDRYYQDVHIPLAKKINLIDFDDQLIVEVSIKKNKLEIKIITQCNFTLLKNYTTNDN